MMKKFKILLVEDDEIKRDDIILFIEEISKHIEIIKSISVNKSLKILIDEIDSIDLIILDMSMPLNDINPNYGSNFSHEKFGGLTFLSNMVEREISVPVIVITMYDSIQETSFNDIKIIINNSFSDICLDLIYYNARENSWKVKLKQLMEPLINV